MFYIFYILDISTQNGINWCTEFRCSSKLSIERSIIKGHLSMDTIFHKKKEIKKHIRSKYDGHMNKS